MRRTSGAIFVPAMVGVAWLVMADPRWWGGWNYTLETVLGTTGLVGPVTAAAAASIAVGERRLAELYDSTPRGWLGPLVAATRAGLLALGVTVLALVVAVGITLSGPHGGPASWWVLSLVPLLLGVHALVGAWLGHVIPSLLTVVLVGPAIFLLSALVPPGLDEVLRNGPVSGTMTGMAYNPVVHAGKVLALVGCAGVILALVARSVLRGTVGRRVAFGAALTSAFASLTVGIGILDAHTTERLGYSEERPTACQGTAPRVCLAPSNSRVLDDLAGRMAEVAAALDRHGMRVPALYEARLPNSAPTGSTGFVSQLGVPGDPSVVWWREAAMSIVRPRACVIWNGPVPPPERAYDAQALLAQWALREAGQVPQPWNDSTERWLDRPVDAEQVAWARATWQALLTCDIDALHLP